MNKLVIFICIAIYSVECYKIYNDKNVLNEWNAFKEKYSKNYPDLETEYRRFEIFQKNRREIEEHNRRYELRLESFTVAVNHFADMLEEEIHYTMNIHYEKEHFSKFSFRSIPSNTIELNEDLPEEVDWREVGAVTRVKSQGQKCGSCWAFAAVGAIESHYFLATGNLTEFSEQNLIDCSKPYGNYGCRGGWPTKAFDYIIENGGIATEESYSPYEENDGKCRYTKQMKGVTIKGYVESPKDDEEILKKTVALVGPVTALINGNHISFQRYNGGVYFEQKCLNATEAPHVVLIVGFGTEYTNSGPEDYWLVKNSYGPFWGDNGYIKMARNRKSHCFIASYASYPVL